MTKEALQLALEALTDFDYDKRIKAIESIKEALETKDEPVGWIDNKGYMICVKTDESCRPLYTTPQTKEWVGLTDEEKAQFVVAYYPSNWDRKTAVSLMSDYE